MDLYKMMKRKRLEPDNVNLPPPVERTHQELRDIADKLDQNMYNYFRKRGLHDGVTSWWETLWQQCDQNGNGRLNFLEFERALRVNVMGQPDEDIPLEWGAASPGNEHSGSVNASNSG